MIKLGGRELSPFISLCLFFLIFIFLPMPLGLWGRLNFPTRDRTLTLGSECAVLTIGPLGNSLSVLLFLFLVRVADLPGIIP